MPVVAREEDDEGARVGLDPFDWTALFAGRGPDLQAASVLGRPAVVEVKDGRHHPVGGAAVAVEVRLVEGARRIDGKMSLEIEESEKQPLVDGHSEVLKAGEIALRRRACRVILQPQHLVAANVFPDDLVATSTDPCPAELTGLPGAEAFARQFQRFVAGKESVEARPPLGLEAFDHGSGGIG